MSLASALPGSATTFVRALVAAILALVVVQATAGRAEAHAQLIESEPADGAMLTSAPAEAMLRFNESVAVLALSQIAPDGAIVRLSGARAEDDIVRVPLAPAAKGTRLLSWRVLSSDGHPVGGTVSFSVGSRSEAPPAATATGDFRVSALLWAVRLAFYLGLFGGVGGAVFAGLVDPLRHAAAAGRSTTRAALALLVAVLPVAVLAEGLDRLGAAPSLATLGPSLAAGLRSPMTVTLAVALAAAAGAVWSLSQEGWRRTALALVAWALGAVSLSLSGHAVGAHPQWLTQPAVALHAGALILWLGALLPFLALARQGRAALLAAIPGFVRLAVPAVAILSATGFVLAAVEVEAPATIVDTNYGLVLAAKLAVVTLLIAAAVINNRLNTPSLMQAAPAAVGRFAGIVRLEIVAATVILALVALFRLTPPPRAILADDRAGVSTHIHTAAAMADVSLVPARAGTNSVGLTLLTGDFGPLPAREVTVRLTKPDAGIEAITVPAQLGSDGRWTTGSLRLPLGGRWQLAIAVLIDDFHRETLTGEIDLRR
ncbi:MAG: copper resistance protein CopC [Ancalomicrobiaceae bacterium]|nr:copper resistance protein CopC [Ancalomicrobiaceae bacterium]